jgi:aryl-alcohol dehydrogenase-like predicted oxidoreductase
MMESVPLGHSTLRVSRLGLGLMSMSGTYGKSDDAACIRVIHHALDRGVSLLDSADMYGWGHNEELLGRALRGRRGGVVLSTKFGQVRSADGAQGVDGRPEYVRQACDASLKRLGVDVIDLYYQHRVDPAVPIEETVGAMGRLREEGKVRALGLSEAAPATIRRAHAVHPISAVQTEYSLLYRREAEETLPTCRELGISFVAYAPLGRGLLTASVRELADIPADDRRRQHPRYQGEHFTQNRALVDRVEVLAKARGVTPGQLVLAWLLAQGQDVVAIPGTKSEARVDENLGALAVRLSAQDRQALADAVPVGAAGGPRYPQAQMERVYL